MEFNNFLELIKEKVQNHLGSDFKVSRTDVTKNNSVRLEGIVITKEGERVSPALYLEEQYSSYRQGKTIDKIVNDLIAFYYAEVPKPVIDLDFFSSFPAIKDQILFKLIHFHKNEELLKEIPYIRFLDMAIVFYISISTESFKNGTILIYHSHRELWDVSAEDLHRLALLNTPKRFPPVIQTMEEIMKQAICNSLQEKLGGEKDVANILDENFWKENPEILDQYLMKEDGRHKMYVLSNIDKLYGAAAILYPTVMQQFAERISADFYLLPSSIHEIILVPDNGLQDREELLGMVNEVNDTQISPEEVLSYSVYYFDRKNGEIALT